MTFAVPDGPVGPIAPWTTEIVRTGDTGVVVRVVRVIDNARDGRTIVDVRLASVRTIVLPVTGDTVRCCSMSVFVRSTFSVSVRVIRSPV